MAPIEERFSDSSGMPPAPRHDALRRDGAGPVRSHAEHGNEEARKPMPRILPGLPNVYAQPVIFQKGSHTSSQGPTFNLREKSWDYPGVGCCTPLGCGVFLWVDLYPG